MRLIIHITMKNCIKKSFKRSEFLSLLLIGTGGIMLSGCAEKSQKPLPNIVLILSDDQGWNDYGFMGHKQIETPNLDRLASESRVFTRGYVNSPLSGPSLSCIITGLHPHQNGVTSNDPPSNDPPNFHPATWPPERKQLREQIISNFSKLPNIPNELKKLGYSSLQTGKWWMNNYSTGGFTHGMTHGDLDKGARHGDEGLRIGRQTMQPIYDFIADQKDSPFFLWYAPILPHMPHTPPERLLNKYREKTDSEFIAAYWATCEWFDETCGALLNHLEEVGIAENTIVLYICDNGWIQLPDRRGHHERSKRSSYEGGIRTPIMVKWPGQVTPGIDETTLVNSIDLAPTILKACGLEPTKDIQGVDLLNVKALKKREAIFGASYTHDAVDIINPANSLINTYVIKGDWKLILPSGINNSGNNPELYNIIEDPEEKVNLAESNMEMYIHLKGLINDWWSEAVRSQP